LIHAYKRLIDTRICEQKIANFELLPQAIFYIRAARSKYFWANRYVCHNVQNFKVKNM